MNPSDFQQKIEHVSRLMATRLGAKGADLQARIDNRSRALPRKVRLAARRLAERQPIMGSPKLMMQMDARAVDRDYRICTKYLEPLGAETRLAMGFVRLVTGIAFIAAVTGGAMLAYAVATGQVAL